MAVYTYEEALSASLEYFNGNQLSADAFLNKYALRNEQNELIEKTPDDMHKRLAREFARVEAKKFKQPYTEEQLYDWFKGFETIIPQGSPMYGIGNYTQYVSTSNCFVVACPEDSYSGILKTDQELAQISKRRGGVGTQISTLRPNHARTNNSSRTSTGPITFAKRYSNTIREVGQDGRRGALMLNMSIHHPDAVYVWDDAVDGLPYDVLINNKNLGQFVISSKYYNPNKVDFTTCKYDPQAVTGANISLLLTDEFLKAVQDDTDFEQRWPVDSKNPKYRKFVKAREAWDKIIYSAWRTAEPGLLFWDTILRESPADCYADFGFRTVSTNPCGEIPLPAFDSCRLMVLNLFGFVVNPFTKNAYFEWAKFYKYAQILQRLMDDLIDLELESIDRIITKIKNDPEDNQIKQSELTLWENIKRICELGRRTGSGITALGDALAALGIGYGSEQGIQFTEQIYKTLKFGSYSSSIEMAKELGPFPIWDWKLEQDNPFLNRFKDEVVQFLNGNGVSVTVVGQTLFNDIQKYGRRNIANLTTAPTGTVSMMAKLIKRHNSSSGIEPEWTDAGYIRKRKINPSEENVRVDSVDQNGDKWHHYKVYPSAIQEYIDVTGDSELVNSPFNGHTAEKIDWKLRVRLQAAAQKHIDHSISSTVNLPNDVSVDKVKEIYETAWKYGCKGITVYRDGCRTGVLTKEEAPKKDVIPKTHAPNRPVSLPCDIYHIKISKKLDKLRTFDYVVLVGLMGQDPYEVFIMENGFLDKKYTHGNITRKGRANYILELEDGHTVNITNNTTELEDALTRLTSTALRHGADITFVVDQLNKSEGDMYSISKAVARALKKYIPDGEIKGEVCSECGGKLMRQDGCVKCSQCSHSRCN